MSAKWFGMALFAIVVACAKQGLAPIIDPVNFATGSEKVTDDEQAAIDKAASVLKNSDWTVLVLGLADATGDAEMNKKLALERAQNVAAILARKSGVPESRIVVHSIGERLATGSSVRERKVEFVFYHETGLTKKEVVIQSGVLEEDFRRANN